MVKGWQRRWFVINPNGEFQYFTDSSKEHLGAKGKQKSKQTLYLKNCTRITSNNLGSGHFELHFPNKMIELRVEAKSRETLAIVEQVSNPHLILTLPSPRPHRIVSQILAGLHTLGALGPSNDGKIHKQTALEQLGVTSAAPAKDGFAGNLNI